MPRDHTLELGPDPQPAPRGRLVWLPLILGVVLLFAGIVFGLGYRYYCEHSNCTPGDQTPSAVCHSRLDVRRGNNLHSPPDDELRECIAMELDADRFQQMAIPAGVGFAALLLGALASTILASRRRVEPARLGAVNQ